VDYELEPTPVSRRSGRSVLVGAAVAVVALAVAVIVGGWQATPIGPSSAVAPSSAIVASPSSPGARAAAAGARTGGTIRSPAVVPLSALRCHDVASAACRQVASAAVDALGPTPIPILAVDVWRSLLCGSDLDCPPALLATLRPAGSAVVRLGGGEPAAWINVGERLASGGSDAANLRGPLVAWLVR